MSLVNTAKKKKKDKDSVDFGPIKFEEHDTTYWESVRDGKQSTIHFSSDSRGLTSMQNRVEN
jgi:hypothetical protein